ncbi:MAG: M20 family peptidase [Rhodospirillales bacterium]|nr:M20 family peptidase [Rhodospirillales bacterium]
MATVVEKSLTELVRINSVNPDLQADGAGENGVGNWVERFCDANGIEHRREPVMGGRSNVFAWLPGREPDRKLLFVAHMDTVPIVGYKGDPFRGERAGDRLYGRGSCDTKASLAAMLQALVQVKKEKPKSTVIVAGSVDEENLKSGAKVMAKAGIKYDGCVAGEPTDLELVVAHKGSVRWCVETKGVACHSSKPHLGHNAIVDMARVITAIEEMTEKFKSRVHPLVGQPTLTMSVIKGGVEMTIVPDHCMIQIDRRLSPGETPKQGLAEVEDVLEMLRKKYPKMNVRSVLPAREDPPLNDSSKERIAEVAAKACAEVANTGKFTGVPYGTDCSQLNLAGIPCVVLGPGSINQAHTVDEFVELAQVEKAVDIYRRIMLSF